MPLIPFYTLLKPKNIWFSDVYMGYKEFTGGIERVQWLEMG